MPDPEEKNQMYKLTEMYGNKQYLGTVVPAGAQRLRLERGKESKVLYDMLRTWDYFSSMQL